MKFRPLLVLAVPVLVVGLGLLAGVLARPDSSGPELRIVIPHGAARQARLHPDREIVPAKIVGRVGQRLVIINRDRQEHQVGPFSVAAGERLEWPLSAEGRIVGICSLQPGKQFVLEVLPARKA